MRILLAEDERSLSRAVVALLEKNNYSADAVYDGEEALAYLEGGNYDGVILDIMMPKMDGLEVLRRLRQAGNPIPVLLLTAKSEVEDKVTGLDMGAQRLPHQALFHRRAHGPHPGHDPQPDGGTGDQPPDPGQHHPGPDHL